LIVFFSDAEKFEIKELENYLKVLYDKDILRGIVVIKRDITSRCKEVL
jgi:hypothetical protein